DDLDVALLGLLVLPLCALLLRVALPLALLALLVLLVVLAADARQEGDRAAVGRPDRVGRAVLGPGELARIAAVGVEEPELRLGLLLPFLGAVAALGDEDELGAVGRPARRGVVAAAGVAQRLAAVGRDDPDLRAVAIVVGVHDRDDVGDARAVGRELRVGDQ